MSPTRNLSPFVSPLLVFTLMLTGAYTGNIPEKHAGVPTYSGQNEQTERKPCPTVETRGKKVSVILHGLMVGHFNDDDKRFEVGIVKRAADHKFSFNIYVEGQGCKYIAPECQSKLKKKKTWVFEVIDRSGKVIGDIKKFTPRNEEEKLNDPGLILNIEDDEFHGGEVDRYKRPFAPVFHFYSGTVKTETITFPLQNRKIESDSSKEEWKSIGPIAEVVKVEFDLGEGKQLVLRDEADKGNVIWRHSYFRRGEVEGRIEHLPAHFTHGLRYCQTRYRDYITRYIISKQAHCKSCERIDFRAFLNFFPNQAKSRNLPQTDEEEDTDATHFQHYYYLVFDKDRPDRFELRKDPSSSCCYTLTKTDEQGRTRVLRTVPPYRCGMALVRDDSDEIKIKE